MVALEGKTLRRTFDHGEHTYDNLLYACARCNSAKSSKLLPDPCQIFTTGSVEVREDGTIEGQTAGARKLIRRVGLDLPESTELRRLWLHIIRLAEHHDPKLYHRLMGFPNDLPNLARLRPPDGNS